MVELAIVLPLLLMLLSAILHFGLLFYTSIQLRAAVVATADYAALKPSNNDAILEFLTHSLPPMVNAADATMAVVAGATRNKGDLLTISVYYDLDFLRSFPFAALIPAPTRIFAVLAFPILV